MVDRRVTPGFLVFILVCCNCCAAQTVLTVAAAADLTNLESALAAQFTKGEPDVQVRFVTASSAVLSQQIDNGAPYDVFLSANAQFADRLGASGKLLPTSIHVYAIGRVAILWRDGKHHPLSHLADDSIRVIALPNPKLAPYGLAAQQALEHARVWKQVNAKCVYGENVSQTLQLFRSGNADAVLTSGSLLIDADAELLPAEWHQPVVQKAGVVSASPNREAARKFLDFLLSSDGQAIFTHFGYAKRP